MPVAKWEVSSGHATCNNLYDGCETTCWESAGVKPHWIRLTFSAYERVESLILDGGNGVDPHNFNSFFPYKVSLHSVGCNNDVELFAEKTNVSKQCDLWQHVPASRRNAMYSSLEIRIRPNGANCKVFGLHLEVQGAQSTFIQDMRGLLEDGAFTDLTFKIGEQCLPAHRNIVAARCPVMHAMLGSGMTESIVGVIEIKDVDFPVMTELLCYLYTDKFTELALADRLAFAAKKYGLFRLKELCGNHLVTQVSKDTCCDLLVLASTLHIARLWTACIEFAVRNASDVSKTAGMRQLTRQHPDLVQQLFVAAACGVAEASKDAGVPQWNCPGDDGNPTKRARTD